MRGGDARAWAAQGRRGSAGEMAEARACGKRAGRAAAQSPFDWTVGRKARSAGPQAAAAERLDGAGNIFAPCMISGPSTRKRPLGGKIRAPCILNRPIAPGNECIGRRCCHLDLEKHAFRADVAREGVFFAHSARKGCMRRDSCQPGPRCRRNARDGDAGGERNADGTRGSAGAMRRSRRTIRSSWQALPQRAPSALR